MGLAFHGYHDLYGRFPPAVLTAPDGKTKYSWRVELLPVLKHYVDGIDPDALRKVPTREQYDELIRACGYNIDEPWDSPENAEALKNMPDVYRHPDDAEGSTESAYYAITGVGTAFEIDHVASTTTSRGGSPQH